jgi:hypothetical protein
VGRVLALGVWSQRDRDGLDERSVVEIVTDQAFRELVRACREAQKRYFRSRGEGALALARELEREIDKELKNQGRPGLFPKED